MRKPTSNKERFDVSLEDLQTFLAVADLRGFSRAAERLSLSQPSVSNRVRRLEEKLGVRLLDRTTRHVELTKDGRRLHARAAVTLQGLRELLREFDAEIGVKRLQVDVAATLMVTTIALPPLVRSFAANEPRIVVRLSDRAPAAALADVAKHRVDMAVLVAEDLPDDLHFELLLADTCVVVTSLGHPLFRQGTATLAEVLRHPLLSPDGHVTLRHAIEVEAEARGLTLDLAEPALGVSNAMTLLAMAAAGLGVLIHPPSLIPPEFLPTIGILRLSDCAIVRSFGIVTARNQPLSLPARAFREHLLASVAAGTFGSAGPSTQMATSN